MTSNAPPLPLFAITEPAKMENDLKLDIRAAYAKHFPNGWLSFRGSILGGSTWFITFGGLKKEDIPNGIIQNDPMYTMVSLDKDCVLEFVSGALMTNPEPGSYMAMKPVKTKFRKKRAKNPDDALRYLSNYFGKLRAIVDANADNIYGGAKI
jgi:hypothetical protein